MEPAPERLKHSVAVLQEFTNLDDAEIEELQHTHVI